MHTLRRRFGAASRALSTPGGAQCIANTRGCGCGSSSHALGVPGGGTCPTFVPRDLVATIKANRPGVDALALACTVMGASLTSSYVLAPVGIPLGLVGATLQVIGNDCNIDIELLKANARMAAGACTVGSIGAGIGAGASVASIIGAPAAVPLGAISAALGVAAPIFAALGEGRAPRFSDVAAFADTLGAVGGFDASAIRTGADSLDAVVNTIASNSAVQAALSALPDARPVNAKKEALRAAKALAFEEAKAAAVAKTRAKSADAAARGERFNPTIPTKVARLDAAPSWLKWAAGAAFGGGALFVGYRALSKKKRAA